MIIVDDNNLDFSNDLITSLKGRGIDCGLFSSIGDHSVKSNDKIYLSVKSEDFDFKTDSKLVPFLKSYGFKKAALLILNAGNFEIEKHLNGALTVMKVPVLGKNGKAQAQDRYNDDLLMACATALYVRDTALRLRQQGIDLARAQLSSFSNLNSRNQAVIKSVGSQQKNPYIVDTPGGQEDISWLLK
jgi:hypothetical protein